MNPDIVVDIARQTVWTVVKTAAPLLLISLTIGLIVSIFQTITSIQEQTLTFLPKFLAIMLTIALAGGWMINNVADLFTEFVTNIPIYIR